MPTSSSRPNRVSNKRFYSIVLVALSLLIVPALAMLFTQEVQWSFPDFFIAAMLLLVTGVLVEMVLRFVPMTFNRILLIGLVLMLLILLWAELAVGIFGTVWAGN